MSVHQLPDGRWLCRYPKGKDPSRPTTNKKYFGRSSDDKRQAAEFNDSLALGQGKAITTPVFADLAIEYMEAKRASLTSSSYAATMVKLEKTICPIIGNDQAHQLTPSKLDKYVSVRSKTVKNTTIHRELSDIRAILLWSVKRKLIASNPMAGFDMPKRDDADIVPPTEEEFERILTCAVPHIKRAMLITRNCGLRPGKEELLCLPWTSFDSSSRTLTVVSAKKGGIPLRIVPLNEKIYNYMSEWCEEDGGEGYIINYNGGKVLRINKGWTSAKKRAKVTRRLPIYSLRHMFVTTLLERGADIKSVSELAGSTPEIIMRWYQYVSTDLKRKTIELLN